MKSLDRKIPMVSVVIPSYNRAGFIVETLNRLFLQTYPNYEVIIVDDASTDNTEELVKTIFKEQLDSGKLRYEKNEMNMERSFSRNKGVEVANGELIAFLDSDDIWQPDHIERGVEQILISDCDVFYTFPAYTDKEHTVNTDKVIDERFRIYVNDLKDFEIDELIARGLITYPTGMFIRRDIFLESGGFRRDIMVAEDWELISRLYFRYCAKINISFRPTYFIRVHSDNTFDSTRYWEDPFEVIKKGDMTTYVQDCDFISEERKKFLIANVLLTRSKIAFARAMLLTGWKSIMGSIRLDPRVLLFTRRGILFFALKRGFIPKKLARGLKRTRNLLSYLIANNKKLGTSRVK